ncbi:hypothetical protein B0H34DRAFT_735013 [Crassisporium funariophilum]|nr:hypothetical protein B0H34DRAFT_735013 [Crassisporium funariophilum]
MHRSLAIWVEEMIRGIHLLSLVRSSQLVTVLGGFGLVWGLAEVGGSGTVDNECHRTLKKDSRWKGFHILLPAGGPSRQFLSFQEWPAYDHGNLCTRRACFSARSVRHVLEAWCIRALATTPILVGNGCNSASSLFLHRGSATFLSLHSSTLDDWILPSALRRYSLYPMAFPTPGSCVAAIRQLT